MKTEENCGEYRECLETDYVQLEQHPRQVMVWGAIGVGYKSPLLVFEGNCNKESYISLLEENGIIPGLNALFGEREFVFQQDNAPPHVAKQTVDWLQERVHLLTSWPPHSPDLSPVEMMWAITKARVDTTGVTTKEDLFESVRRVWDEIPQSFVDNMASSFEARSRTVIRLYGDSLNGHWLYVHKIHILLQRCAIEEIDTAIEAMEWATSQTSLERDACEEVSPFPELTQLEKDFMSEISAEEEVSPFLELTQLETDFMSEISAEDEDEISEALIWEHNLGEQAIEEVCHVTSNRPSAWRRLVNTMQTTARFLFRLFSRRESSD